MDPEANPVVQLVHSHHSAIDDVEKCSQGTNHLQETSVVKKAPSTAILVGGNTDTDDFPGDRWALSAWVVLAGSFLALFPSFGLMVSIGTLQEYWQFHQLSSYSSQFIGWIPSVFVYLSLGLGICFGPLFEDVSH